MARTTGKSLDKIDNPLLPKAPEQNLAFYECGALRFTDRDYVYDRHLVFDQAVSLEKASDRQRLEAVSRALRDLLTQRWLLTEETYERANAKRVYYLSMEFLIGRTLINNIIISELSGSSAITCAQIPTRIGPKLSTQSPMPASAMAAWGGWRRASWTRLPALQSPQLGMDSATNTGSFVRR
jgi:starch phosphorylase